MKASDVLMLFKQAVLKEIKIKNYLQGMWQAPSFVDTL